MLAIGALAYTLASDLSTERTLSQLNALAEAKKQELEKVVQGWRDGVSLIASRTQLRLSLQAHNATPSAEQQERIRRILEDARLSSQAVQSLTVYDADGRPVALVGSEPERQLAEPEPSLPSETEGTAASPDIFFTADEEPRASFLVPLILNGQRIGALQVVLSARELIDATQDSIGLGETGEMMIVLRDSAGVTRVLHPVRQRATERPGPVQPGGRDDPATWALEGRDTVIAEGLIDYRGEPVWAATSFLPEVGWGVVVKFDTAEERASIRKFRQQLTQLGLSLSAFAILLGTFLGLRFARPIHDLAGVANRIRLGELSARARVEREDEMGLLARTFNQMAEELEQQVTLLHEFQKYFEVSLDMLCIAGTDAYFKRVNPAFERTLGWPTETLLTRPFIEFVHPDDVDNTVHEIEKLSQGIPTVSFTNRYRCADGSWKLLMWTAHPEPKMGLIYAIARDITESKQASGRSREGGEPESTEPA
jgi:PAS domain S-box-containing protein